MTAVQQIGCRYGLVRHKKEKKLKLLPIAVDACVISAVAFLSKLLCRI